MNSHTALQRDPDGRMEERTHS